MLGLRLPVGDEGDVGAGRLRRRGRRDQEAKKA